MSPKPGTPVTLVPPTAPKDAKPADDAVSGDVTKVEPAPTHRPPETQEEKEVKDAWIELEMVDEAGAAVAGIRYEITLPDGSVAEGTLDGKGIARVSGFEPGDCKIRFPELDQEAWDPA